VASEAVNCCKWNREFRVGVTKDEVKFKFWSEVMLPSVLLRCWLGDRKGIRPVKNWAVGCWHGYLPGARCRLDMAQLMPLPLTVSCFSKIQIDFTFLVLAHSGSPRQRAVKWVCVCVWSYGEEWRSTCTFIVRQRITDMTIYGRETVH